MYVMGENPVMSDPDQNHTVEGMCKLDTLVVQDIFMTETAWYADVIFPASAHAEKDGTFTNTNRQIQMGRQVVSPPGEAKKDLDIIIEFAKKLGLSWNYRGPADVFNEMSQIMPSLKIYHGTELKGKTLLLILVMNQISQEMKLFFLKTFQQYQV